MKSFNSTITWMLVREFCLKYVLHIFMWKFDFNSPKHMITNGENMRILSFKTTIKEDNYINWFDFESAMLLSTSLLIIKKNHRLLKRWQCYQILQAPKLFTIIW